MKLKFKRLIDIIGSLIGLTLSSPVIVIVSLVIYFSMGRPIFFKQVRPGLKGKPFKIYKFRTMVDLKDEKGNLLPDEKRLTSIGKFLRSTTLDELPEFWNVLKGDVSLVGLRPLLMEYLKRYNFHLSKTVDFYRKPVGHLAGTPTCKGGDESIFLFLPLVL
jgi:lipopolysaccharide/colanic/teichoic acid biosynthesis glycosyltransferase